MGERTWPSCKLATITIADTIPCRPHPTRPVQCPDRDGLPLHHTFTVQDVAFPACRRQSAGSQPGHQRPLPKSNGPYLHGPCAAGASPGEIGPPAQELDRAAFLDKQRNSRPRPHITELSCLVILSRIPHPQRACLRPLSPSEREQTHHLLCPRSPPTQQPHTLGGAGERRRGACAARLLQNSALLQALTHPWRAATPFRRRRVVHCSPLQNLAATIPPLTR
jgi:hypothetical protein